VRTEARGEEIVRICNENGWQVIVGIEPEEPENISDVKKLLNQRKTEPTTYNPKPAKVGPNDYCPCGSGLKYKKCCLDREWDSEAEAGVGRGSPKKERGSTDMIIPKVRLEVWKELFETAVRFREAAPWEIFNDDEVFAVEDPGTKEIGYCCVLGRLGEMFALCVYRGHEGWAIHQKLQKQEIDPERDDFFAINNALMAEFTDRKELDKEDLRIIKDLGYKFRGGKAYPAFRSYLPGYAPWFLTESEAVFLEFALRCGLDYYNGYDEEAVALERKDLNRILLYTRKSNGGEGSPFEKKWFRPGTPPPPEVPHIPVDEIRLEKIKKRVAPSKEIWEGGVFYFPGGQVVDRDRPYFPRLVTVAEKSSGLILFSNLIALETCRVSMLWEGLIKAMENRGTYPAEIQVNEEIALKALRPLADFLNIRIKMEKKLSALLEFKKAMREDFRKGRI
jgi:hypothetical protein